MSDDSWGFASGDHIGDGVIALTSLGGGIAYEAWVAFDERLYAPVVAKVMRPSAVVDVDKRADFDREIEFLTALNHPSVVRLFSFAADVDTPHMVIENIDGPNLSTLISRHGPLPVQQLVPLAIELGAAAHYLHGQGICHLDIKPSNVIMGAPAKLIDFSVALRTQEAEEADRPIGSDQYMAPEQCLPGERGRMSPASDMWGIGATLFRAAAGRRAYPSGDEAAEGSERWPQIELGPRPMPDFVPRAFTELVLACLAPEAADRPQPAQFVDALEPIMADMPQARLSGFKIKI